MDRFLTRDQVASSVGLDHDSLACLIGCLTRHAQGRGGSIAAHQLELPATEGRLTWTSARIDGVPVVALRSQGESTFLQLQDSRTGELRAVLLDEGYLQELAQALVVAVSTRYLAPEALSGVRLLRADGPSLRALRGLLLVRDVPLVMAPEGEIGSGPLPELCQQLDVPLEAAPPEELFPPESVVLLSGPPGDLQGGDPEGCHVVTLGEKWIPWILDQHTHFQRVACIQSSRSRLAGRLPRELIDLGRFTSRQTPGRRSPSLATLALVEAHPSLDAALSWLAWRKAREHRLGTPIPNPSEANP